MVLDGSAAKKLLHAYPTATDRNQLLAGLLSPDSALFDIRPEAAEAIFADFTGEEEPTLVHRFAHSLSLDPLTRWCLLHPPRAKTLEGGGAEDFDGAGLGGLQWELLGARVPTEIVCCGRRPGGSWITLHAAAGAPWADGAQFPPTTPPTAGLAIVAVGHHVADLPLRPRMQRRPSHSALEDIHAFEQRSRQYGAREMLWRLIEPPIPVRGGGGYVYRTATADVSVLWPQASAIRDRGGRAVVQPMTGWFKRRGHPSELLQFAGDRPWAS